MQTGNGAPLFSGQTGLIGRLTYFAVVTWDERALPHHREPVGRLFYPLFLKHLRVDEGLNPEDELMLVLDVQSVKRKQIVFPARIGFGVAYCLDDLFSGELYASSREHRFKSLKIIRERELDTLWSHGVKWRDYLPNELVEGGMQIVNGIADDKCELWWDGFVFPKVKVTDPSFGILHKPERARARGKKGRTFVMKIDEMLLRAANF